MVNKKKISGILQEIIKKGNEKYIIVGIGINLVKNPYIISYPTTSLLEVTNKIIKKDEVINKLKKIYEKFIPKINSYEISKLL